MGSNQDAFITFDDWLWKEQFPIEDLSEEEINRIIEQIADLPLKNMEKVGDTNG